MRPCTQDEAFEDYCTEEPPAACTNRSGDVRPAFPEGISLGCSDSLGTPVDFANWNDFWCQPSDNMDNHRCQLACTAGSNVHWVIPNGPPVAAGYSVSVCSPKSIDGAATTFVPRDSSGQLKAASETELLLEMTMVKSMVDRSNAGCVTAADAGRITTGTQKMMFTMTRE